MRESSLLLATVTVISINGAFGGGPSASTVRTPCPDGFSILCEAAILFMLYQTDSSKDRACIAYRLPLIVKVTLINIVSLVPQQVSGTMIGPTLLDIVAALILANLITASPVIERGTGCKVLPDDAGWPSDNTWNQLNQTVGGRLISSIPQAAVCHTRGYNGLAYNEEECADLKAQWNYPQTYEPFSNEIMNPYYQNQSCDPYTSTNRSCELGNYVSYAINVTGPSDVIAGIQFAKKFNVRLVIKNTGHDFLGKSTGKGGLSLWMWNLKTSNIMESYRNDDSTWNGPAVKLGAGMTGYDAIELVGPAGYTLVSGDCPTVGITGGYTQGGGHSFLNSEYGMAADQVLEWEVITADERHLFASPSKHADLYWALSGGGAGTYAVVLSMTVKLHPESRVGAAALSFNSSDVSRNGSYTAAVQAWWQFLPQLVDTGANVLWAIESGVFFLESFTALNKSADQVHEMFQPYLSRLDALGVTYAFSSSQQPSYFSHYNASNGPLPYGVYPTTMLFNSRIIPRLISEDAERALNLTVTMQNAVDQPIAADWPGWGFGCSAFNVSKQSHPDNAVAPFWRDAIAICIEIALWDWTIPRQDMLDRKLYMADVITPTMEAATPEGGAYLNEADPWVYRDDIAHWQDAFYGSNYPKLRQIKDKWDPDSVFYAYTAVGSEDWELDVDGRLCKA